MRVPPRHPQRQPVKYASTSCGGLRLLSAACSARWVGSPGFPPRVLLGTQRTFLQRGRHRTWHGGSAPPFGANGPVNEHPPTPPSLATLLPCWRELLQYIIWSSTCGRFLWLPPCLLDCKPRRGRGSPALPGTPRAWGWVYNRQHLHTASGFPGSSLRGQPWLVGSTTRPIS